MNNDANTNKDFEYERLWKRPAIKIGMITMLFACILTMLPIVYIMLVHGIYPSAAHLLTSWGLVAAVFGAFYIVEPLSYYPILGLAGTYISFLSGNISNLRLPCSAMAQEVAEVKEGSREGELIGTMGIVGSVVINLIFVTLAAVIGFYVIRILPEIIQDAFRSYTAPAIFGAVFGQFALREIKLAPFALGIPLILLLLGAPVWITILAAVFGTIGIARIFYIKGIIKPS